MKMKVEMKNRMRCVMLYVDLGAGGFMKAGYLLYELHSCIVGR